MSFEIEFENALKSENPINALRELVIFLNQKGIMKQKIYNIFYDYYQFLQKTGRTVDENILGDVMDMIADTYPPFDLRLR
ncbi:MAG: hypothetical protein JW841_05435 [Deltaproteobacteria bacterium]|nr:hypothetical protein [Deltaproteobacteria bacterium]